MKLLKKLVGGKRKTKTKKATRKPARKKNGQFKKK